ncbi:MAG: nuclear transport factor 2 family protein [Verrucomicrobiota bacterium]|nr:nuclear transport factor 2 family protein [Verrucomicrobiota bacterium]
MKRIFQFVTMLLLVVCGLFAQTGPVVPAVSAENAPELTTLLHEFLAGAGRDDVAMHERFWADDLIYTSAKGVRKTKADIMRDMRSAAPPKPGDEATVYTAEEVRIQQYGQAAIVAFRLVAMTEKEGTRRTASYLNTGTFVNRDGKWRAVGWQATAIPETAEQSP